MRDALPDAPQVTAVSGYEPKKTKETRVLGNFAQINLKPPASADATAAFLRALARRRRSSSTKISPPMTSSRSTPS